MTDITQHRVTKVKIKEPSEAKHSDRYQNIVIETHDQNIDLRLFGNFEVIHE